MLVTKIREVFNIFLLVRRYVTTACIGQWFCMNTFTEIHKPVGHASMYELHQDHNFNKLSVIHGWFARKIITDF